MVQRPAGPYLFDIPYTVEGLVHHLTVNCDTVGNPAIGTPANAVTLETKSGDGILLNGAADDFWTAARKLLTTTVSASTYTLWRMNPDNNDKVFISGGTLTNPNGFYVGAANLTSQVTLTLRTGGGNVTKLQFMEAAYTDKGRYAAGVAPYGEVNGMFTWALSPNSFMLGRDRAFPVVGMNASFEAQNDRLFERRYRS